jgi:RNA polymerase sigma-70 factor (ECF subfamily)
MPDAAGKQRWKGNTLTGDQAASIDELYREYSGWLARALRKRVRAGRDEIEDVVQETYLRLSTYSSLELSLFPKALLLRIGMNLVRDRARRLTVRERFATSFRDGYFGRQQISTEADQEQLLDLKRVILALPPPLRKVFVLSRFTQMSYDDIAAHLDISAKTVEWRMRKALAICAAQLLK